MLQSKVQADADESGPEDGDDLYLEEAAVPGVTDEEDAADVAYREVRMLYWRFEKGYHKGLYGAYRHTLKDASRSHGDRVAPRLLPYADGDGDYRGQGPYPMARKMLNALVGEVA